MNRNGVGVGISVRHLNDISIVEKWADLTRGLKPARPLRQLLRDSHDASHESPLVATEFAIGGDRTRVKPADTRGVELVGVASSGDNGGQVLQLTATQRA